VDDEKVDIILLRFMIRVPNKAHFIGLLINHVAILELD